MLLAIGIFLLAVAVFLVVEHFRFRARAITVEAEVVEVREMKSQRSQSGSSGLGGGMTILYRPVYRYTDAEGRVRDILSTKASDDMNYEIGSTRSLMIDPKHPGTGREAASTPWFVVAGLLVGAIFVIAGDWYGFLQ